MSLTSPPFLNGLRGDELAFQPDEAVFHLGAIVRRVHWVREGVIHLVRHQRNGSALVLQRAGPGSILAEASLYSTRYHCDARAETTAST